MLYLQSVTIPYINSSTSAVWQQNIQFEKEELIHIKASSGKGKSSLVQTIYGINKHYKGELFFNKKKYTDFTVDDWCNFRTNQVSIVFQDLKLFEENSAFENIEIKRLQTNFCASDKVKEFAEKLDVSHALNRKIKTLSYGERQRIAIIRALMQPFQLLLLDEPFSHLDEANITKACTLIQQEVESRKATLILLDLEQNTYFNYHKNINL